MQHRGPQLLVSPADLAEFMSSRFASWMTRYALDHPEVKPGVDLSDPDALPGEAEILQRKGQEHEAQVLASLRERGLGLVEIDVHGMDSVARTLDAMRAGSEVVYQARLEHGGLVGIADFLVRVPGASVLGDFHYEVWDAKLSRRARPTQLIQLCCYGELLEAIQGRRPTDVALVLGDGGLVRFRLDDFFYFHLALRETFAAFLRDWREDAPPVPDASSNHGRWQEAAERRLEELDHVSRVAFSTRNQVERLARAGIHTLAELAATALPKVAGIRDETLRRLGEQARLQCESTGLPQPLFRVLREEEVPDGKGLCLLPPVSAGDVFFDLEGDPLEEDGLEYLWGAGFLDRGGQLAYRDWWAHDAQGERRALEGFFDWVMERWREQPDLHIFHYGSYEVAALRRLVGREATRGDELDRLLRANVFVDLYPIVRHGLRVGEPSYSLKNVEKLYRSARGGDVTSGMESVVVYDAWKQKGETSDWRRSLLLRRIRDYNEEDCRSTAELAAWLRERQKDAGIAHRVRSDIAEEGAAAAAEERPEARIRRELAQRRLADVPKNADDQAQDPERFAVLKLLGQLVEFHHREALPVWWEFYDRSALSAEERWEVPDCLAGLRRTARPPEPIKQSLSFEYAFDPEQDTKIGAGEKCRIAQLPELFPNVEEIDFARGTVLLKVSRKALSAAGVTKLPDRACLVRWDWVGTDALETSIQAVASRFHSDNYLASALRDLLLRRLPRIRGHDGGRLRAEGEPIPETFLRLVRGLDDSVLCVQGPPGSGKTTESARVICALLRGGRKVGITSNAHTAIVHLMNACAEANSDPLACVKVGHKDDPAPEFPGAEKAVEAANGAARLSKLSLIGGTAWCFSHPALAGKLDYLFVDEASQVSLANLVAMSPAARNIVLVGDQMQLSQPIRGSHPGESGLSALEYVLHGHQTIPDDRGLFLENTHRLHPAICEFVSGAFYEDRLRAAAGNERRVLTPAAGGGPLRLGEVVAGIAFVPVDHEGNSQGSDEEVACVRDLIAELRQHQRVGDEGEPSGPIGSHDILVVAPYNLQVRKLLAALPSEARVGTVDRFQGQQAAVVIVSMCASEPHLSARGIQFLFHPNRLNVAVSRAQSLAVVVGSRRLTTALCRSIAEMRLVNRVCRLVQTAWIV